MVQKFRIFFRSIKSLPENVDNITTCILHNYIKDNVLLNQHLGPPECEPDWGRTHRQGGNALTTAFNVRETYKTFFNFEIDHYHGREISLRKIYK